MPAKNQNTPDSLRSRIRLFLATNPGERFRPRDVATALDSDYIRVASELSRMALEGQLTREGYVPEGKKRQITTYALAPQEAQK